MKTRNNCCYTLSNSVTAPPPRTHRRDDAGSTPHSDPAVSRHAATPWTIFNHEGQRKYLTPSELDAFLQSAQDCDIAVRSFCWMLAASGCRISEALMLTRTSIDFESGHVIILSLKKRGARHYRAVPLPPDYLKVIAKWLHAEPNVDERLWPWSRMTGYRRICEVMHRAGIKGSYATPKGLRHGFGVRAIQSNIPITLVQKWLGHADIKTTAIYTSALGPEERAIAARMWRRPRSVRSSNQMRRAAGRPIGPRHLPQG